MLLMLEYQAFFGCQEDVLYYLYQVTLNYLICPLPQLSHLPDLFQLPDVVYLYPNFSNVYLSPNMPHFSDVPHFLKSP